MSSFEDVLHLDQNGHNLNPASSMLVLGVELDSSGSAALWICSVRGKASKTLHLFRLISQKTGAASSHIAHIVVRSVLQPRLIYQIQLHHLTRRDWDLLETVNQEARRVITGLPTLQAKVQLNTLDKLVEQRRSARHLKIQTIPATPAWAYSFDSRSPVILQK